MKFLIDPNVPVKQHFSIPEHLTLYDVSILFAAANDDDYNPDVSAIVNCLRYAHHINLKQTLDCKWYIIAYMRNMGFKRQALFLDLLKRIADNPDHIDNIIQSQSIPTRAAYINEVIRQNKLAHEKEKKLSEIERRLREMGMIK